MRKTRKSKIVILSILGLAAVSIGSIGFATWLVGINKTEETLHVEAKVDNSVNDSQYLEIAVNGRDFHIAEKSAIDRNNSNIVGANANAGENGLGVKSDALTFDIDTFTVLVGKGVTSRPRKVVLELTAGDNEFNAVSASADLIQNCQYTQGSGETATLKTIGARTESSLTYLSYKEEFLLSSSTYFTNDESTTSNSYITYTFKASEKTRTMSWGSFYTYNNGTGDVTGSPATYYNSLYKKYTTDPNSMTAMQKFDFADQINKEITALNAAFKGRTLTIKATLE